MIRILNCLLLLGLILSFTDCKETDDSLEVSDFRDIDIVTGLDLYDFNGTPVGSWEKPNHKPGDAFVFPIPNNGIVSFNSQLAIKNIWIVAASCAKDELNTGIETESNQLVFSTSDIEAASVQSFLDLNQSSLQLNLQDRAEGFYKLFYQNNSDELFWYNMYIDPDQENYPDIDVLDNACN